MARKSAIKHPIEELGGSLKKSAWSAVIESIIIIIFGILLVIWPSIVLSVLSTVLGVILIVLGVCQIINYFVVGGQNDFFDNSLLTGVIFTLIGIAAIVIGEDIANVFRIIVGIWIIYESLVRINSAIKLHAAGISNWPYVLIVAIILLAAGIFITFNTTAVLQLIGGIMIISGIVGIVGDAMFIQKVDAIEEKLTKK